MKPIAEFKRELRKASIVRVWVDSMSRQGPNYFSHAIRVSKTHMRYAIQSIPEDGLIAFYTVEKEGMSAPYTVLYVGRNQ